MTVSESDMKELGEALEHEEEFNEIHRHHEEIILKAARLLHAIAPELNKMVEVRKDAPTMEQITQAQANNEMQRNISLTDKGREFGTTEHIAASMRLQALGEKSLSFYSVAANAVSRIAEIIGEN